MAKRVKSSNRTILRKLKQGYDVCPVCGSGSEVYTFYRVPYPEVWSEVHCRDCGMKLGYEDNSPWRRLYDDVVSLGTIKMSSIKKVIKEWRKL